MIMANRLSQEYRLNQEGFESFLEGRNDPSWVVELRRQGWEKFQSQAWPSRSEEEWIRTDIRRFRLDAMRYAPGQSIKGHTPLLGDGVELSGRGQSVNSESGEFELDPQLKEKGVVFSSLDDAVAEHSELVKPLLFRAAVDPFRDRFASLHTAFWSGGVFVYVPRGVVIEKPLLFTSTLSGHSCDFGHVLVFLDEGAEATILTEQSSVGDSNAVALHCGGSEVVVGANAKLRLVHLQNWNHSTWHFAQKKAVVQRDGRLQWTISAMGAQLSKVNQQVLLAGEGAESQVNGVLFAEGKQHQSYHTLQHHAAPHTRSDFLYKAALQDSARTVWRGMIKVDENADKTDGYQRNDNLMLSEQSRADSIPGLEILTDDVRCTHGSTTGKVDPELIFYCQTRGLTRKEATRAVVSGFFQQIFDRIQIESVASALGNAINQRVREFK